MRELHLVCGEGGWPEGTLLLRPGWVPRPALSGGQNPLGTVKAGAREQELRASHSDTEAHAAGLRFHEQDSEIDKENGLKYSEGKTIISNTPSQNNTIKNKRS